MLFKSYILYRKRERERKRERREGKKRKTNLYIDYFFCARKDLQNVE